MKKLQEELQGRREATQAVAEETDMAFKEFQATLDQELSQQPVGGT